jgi:hypothetical protein
VKSERADISVRREGDTSPAMGLTREALNRVSGGIWEAFRSSHLLTRVRVLVPEAFVILNRVVGFVRLLSDARSTIPFLASQTVCSSGKSFPTFVRGVTPLPNLEQTRPAYDGGPPTEVIWRIGSCIVSMVRNPATSTFNFPDARRGRLKKTSMLHGGLPRHQVTDGPTTFLR